MTFKILGATALILAQCSAYAAIQNSCPQLFINTAKTNTSAASATTMSPNLVGQIAVLQMKGSIKGISPDLISKAAAGLKSPLAPKFIGADWERCAARWSHPTSVKALMVGTSAAAKARTVEEASSIALASIRQDVFPTLSADEVAKKRVCPAMASQACRVLNLTSCATM